MSTVTVKLMSICAGGNHLTFSVTGDASLATQVDLSAITGPLSHEDVDSFLKVIGKLARNGRTFSQARALLQSGVTITV